jgi:adenylyltransferase/sulfurtransferase
MQPDYSRQMLLKEIGAGGQATLENSRVLVVGAGGLGSPVLQYLAGAGVGCLRIADADVLDASNLHRQPLYAFADIGRPKAELAAAAVRGLNPKIRVESLAIRFNAENALALVEDCDIVVDCSDNFRTKFLLNDAAVLACKPAVFASVYQYEGQLQTYKPQAGHACLRCLWPEATGDGLVGNCAEAGVLGPVPGTLGSLQALLTLKLLLGIPGQLEGELLLLDFMNFSTVKLRAPRLPECRAPVCTRVRPPARDATDLELALPSLAGALECGLELIDIRNDDEVAARPIAARPIAARPIAARPIAARPIAARPIAARPIAARHIPMATLLADPSLLSLTSRYLLVCASGKRSLAAARELRERGFDVSSLAGGLQRLDP